MVRNRSLSAPARKALSILAEAGDGWCHGYDLCQEAGIKSGTLYPLLIRLEAQGHLEAEWQPPAEAGRPPRHAYRLTAAGRQLARDNPPAAPEASGSGRAEGFA
jgi:PadR family transcriptional regulator PadR